MAKSYRCKDGDRIDLVVLDNYGSLDMLARVLAVNVHLSKMPLVLTSGTEITLPDAVKTVTVQVKKEGALW